jgi:oxygen-independent coproporphyrinogen-3 oxidase
VEFGLYLHLPYCRSLCPYCDFVKAPLHRAEPGRLVSSLALEATLAREADATVWGRPRTVYFGGGTPTVLPPDELKRLVAAIGSTFDLVRVREFSVEANPEGFSDEVLAVLRGAGVTRLSLGVQSLEPAVLRVLGRIHTPERALDALDRARTAGFGTLSADLMYGIPGETPEGFARALAALIDRRVPHVSAYPLQVEEGTPLAAKVARGTLPAPDEEWVAARYEQLVSTLAGAGYQHYEVSNFALPGHESRHNEGYWIRRPYLGLGPGAHSFDGRARWRNEESIPRYMERVERGELPREEVHVLSSREAAEERVFLGLRRARGLRARTHLRGVPGSVLDGWTLWARKGKALREHPQGRFRPTDRGLFLAHDLAAELLTRARLTPVSPPC